MFFIYILIAHYVHFCILNNSLKMLFFIYSYSTLCERSLYVPVWPSKALGDIVELEAKLRLQPGISRILGASRVWDQDWGLPRVKCGTGGCNPTLCQPEAGLVTSWSERSERSDENPVRWLALQSTSDPLRLQLYNTRGGRPPLLSVAAALRRWRWWQVGEVCGLLSRLDYRFEGCAESREQAMSQHQLA